MSSAEIRSEDLRMNDVPYLNPAARIHSHLCPAITVVIPTYNRCAHLEDILNRWQQQEGLMHEDYEVVLADDGSSDGSPACVQEWAERAPMRVVLYASRINHGPAYARNRAIALASGSSLLITGDDILPPHDFLVRHLDWHRANADVCEALLGSVCWPDQPPPSRFMTWLETAGRAFFFSYPDSACVTQPDRFYTCNVSLKRALLEQVGGFDEHFPYASHEDLELGMRLARLGGMRLHYDPELVAEHDHRLTLESSIRRVHRMGLSSIVYWDRVPGASPAWKTRLRRLLLSIASQRFAQRTHAALSKAAPKIEEHPWLWKLTLTIAYWAGAGEGWRNARCTDALQS